MEALPESPPPPQMKLILLNHLFITSFCTGWMLNNNSELSFSFLFLIIFVHRNSNLSTASWLSLLILEDSDVRHNSPFPCPGSYIHWPILKEISPPPTPHSFSWNGSLKRRESVSVVIHAFFASWIEYYDLFSFSLSLKAIQKQQYLQRGATVLRNMSGGRGGLASGASATTRTAVRRTELRFHWFNT